MKDSCKESTIHQDDWGQLAADGGSNAIGSIREFESVTRSEDGALISTSVIHTRMSAQVGMHRELSGLQIAPTMH
jgi:hypothetical protein